MAFESTSPNMNLVLPGVGATAGPQWSADLNASLTIIDAHDHTAGNGLPITPSALNINADLGFGANNATNLRSSRYIPQASLALPADLNAVYVSGVDLYYIDGAGNNVRLTQSGSIVGTSGSIANLVSPASATYVGTPSFTVVFQSDVSTPANLDGASLTIRNRTASSQGITLSAPAGLGSSYTLTLPALPPGQQIMTLDNSGNLAAPYTVDGTYISIQSNVIRITPASLTTAQLSPTANIPGTQLAAAADILPSQLQAATSAFSAVAGPIVYTASTYTVVTSVTLNTVVGRPVIFSFSGSNTTSTPAFSASLTISNTAQQAVFKLYEGSTPVSGDVLLRAAAPNSEFSPSIINFAVIATTTGSTTYNLNIAVSSGAALTLQNFLMKAAAF